MDEFFIVDTNHEIIILDKFEQVDFFWNNSKAGDEGKGRFPDSEATMLYSLCYRVNMKVNLYFIGQNLVGRDFSHPQKIDLVIFVEKNANFRQNYYKIRTKVGQNFSNFQKI